MSVHREQLVMEWSSVALYVNVWAVGIVEVVVVEVVVVAIVVVAIVVVVTVVVVVCVQGHHTIISWKSFHTLGG